MSLLNVVIVMGRCSRSRRPFGIRFEEKERGCWVGDWAFPVAEAAARKEGYDRGEISGALGFDHAFPGCPSCRSRTMFKCACGKVACWDGERRSVTCPWCGATGEVGGQVDRLNAGSDR